jgi:ABC-2 type transport system ATP-binding protein
MNEEYALEIQGLTKSYGQVQALRGVDLEVQRGKIFGFLGPNGAGKTTTIRCLLDLIRPSSGTVRVLGLDPQADSVAVRARVGYLPGELNLESNLTAEGALRYFDDLRGRQADWDFVRQLARRLELDLATPIKNLSRGNKQKVGVVQALMARSELLLLDEPTSGLDPLMQQEVYRLLREAQAAGATAFFSSHIISEVEAIAEQVAIIRQGVIVEVAEPHQLLSMSLRRVRVRFSEPIDPSPLAHVPGISLLSQNGANATLQVEGEIDGLIKALAAFPVADLETERPSLEEIFLAYYQGSETEVA